MEFIELIELTKPQELNTDRKFIGDFLRLQNFQRQRGFNPYWVWFAMANKIHDKNPLQYKAKLTELAEFYCKVMEYKQGRAFYMVKNYLEKKVENKAA
jgi:hypothetical protein